MTQQTDSDNGSTHWDGCWKVHIECARQRIEELEKKIEQMYDERGKFAFDLWRLLNGATNQAKKFMDKKEV